MHLKMFFEIMSILEVGQRLLHYCTDMGKQLCCHPEQQGYPVETALLLMQSARAVTEQ